MTPQERLIAQIKAQRQSWVEVAPATETQPAKRVRITRPPENDVADFVTERDGRRTLEVGASHVVKYVVDWDGVLESDLVGAAGSSDPAPFNSALFAIVVEDRLPWMRTIASALLDSIVAHHEAQQTDAKN